MKLRLLLIFILCSLTSVMSTQFVLANQSIINGEVHYSGTKSGAVRVALLNLQMDFNEILDVITLETGPGMYQFDSLAAGTYFVGAFMDVNEDGMPGLTEPLGAHAKPIVITDMITLDSIDIFLNELPRGNSSISGSIVYDGELSGKPHIFALGLTGTPFTFDCPAEGNSYTVEGLMPGKYMLVGFLDIDENGQPGLGEPLGFIDERIDVGNSEDLPGYDITLKDPGDFTGTIAGSIQYSGPESGTVYVYAVGKSYTPVKMTQLTYPETVNYELTNVAPGGYYIFAHLDTNDNKMYDPLNLTLKPIPAVEKGEPYELIVDTVIVENGGETQQNLLLDVDGEAGISGTISYDGTNKGFLVLTAAVGLSPTWMGLAVATPQPPQKYSYTIPDLDAGYYGVLGIMINSLDLDFENIKNILEMPIGFYTKGLVCVKPPEITQAIDFVLQDTSTSTSTITGTVSAPEGMSGDIHLFALGLSLTPYHHAVLTDERSFAFMDLRMGRFLVGGFMDVNGNGTFDIGEPFDYTESMVEIPEGDITEQVELVMGNKFQTTVQREDDVFKPGEYVLGQNYPNPFNPTTKFKYQIPEDRHVEIRVYNMLGHEVRTLVNRQQIAGIHNVSWDAKNNIGVDVASGVYFYCLKAGNYIEFRKMTLLR